MYDQLLQSIFSLLGFSALAQYHRDGKIENDMVPMKELSVYPELCSSDYCKNCLRQICHVCVFCLSPDAITTLKRSYIEHVNRRDCIRLFPPEMVSIFLGYEIGI